MFSRLWTNHKAETDKCKIQLGILTLVWPTTAGYWMFIFYLGLSFPLLLLCHPRQCLPLILLFGFFINGLDPQIPADPSRKVWRNWIVMMRDGVDTARRGHKCNMLWHFSQTIALRSFLFFNNTFNLGISPWLPIRVRGTANLKEPARIYSLIYWLN